jgi:hypothetical protein
LEEHKKFNGELKVMIISILLKEYLGKGTIRKQGVD